MDMNFSLIKACMILAIFGMVALPVFSESHTKSEQIDCSPYRTGPLVEREMYTAFDLVDVDPERYLTIRYNRAYEFGRNPVGAMNGDWQPQFKMGFALDLNVGAPVMRSDVPSSERDIMIVSFNSRERRFTVAEQVPYFSWGSVPMVNLGPITNSEPEIIGKLEAFHGFTEFTFAPMSPTAGRSQFYFYGSDPNDTDVLLKCTRVDAAPYPSCTALIQDDIFEIKTRIRRPIMDRWPEIEHRSREFSYCMTHE